MDIYLGIDFGAENIMVAYKIDSSTSINHIPFNGKDYCKNYYAFDNTGNEYFGNDALEAHLDDNKITFISKYKQDLAKDNNDLNTSKYKNIRPIDILIKMLSYIKQELTLHIQTDKSIKKINLKNTVITVPIHWEEKQKINEIYKVAMQKCGFEHFRIVSEPVAAAAQVITKTQDHYDQFALDNSPQINDSILLVDIGASTLDINLCLYQNPIHTIVGLGNEFAGNYFDALLCHHKDGRELEKLIEFDSKYINELDEIKELKEKTGRNNFKRFLEKESPEVEKYKIAIDTYVKTLSDSIVETINQRLHQPINYFVICGGMSQLKANNFLENLFDNLKEKLPNKFNETIFFNLEKKFKDEFLNKAIVNGACMLAVNPDLVTRNLPYNFGMIINTTDTKNDKSIREKLPIVLLEKGIPIRKTNAKYSLIDKLKKEGYIEKSNKLVETKKEDDTNSTKEHSPVPSYRLTTEAFTNPNEPIKMFYSLVNKEILHDSSTLIKIIEFNLTRQYKRHANLNEINVDATCYIDENSIVNVDIIDVDNNKIVAQGQFKEFEKIRENLMIRI